LESPGRSVVWEGTLMMKKAVGELDCTVFLFDHLLLVTKIKEGFFKIMRKVIFAS
jgi:hypothetical protein